MSPYDDDDDADDHPQRKRRRSLSSACDDIEEQPSAKRRKKAGIVDDNNNNNYPPEFWDALSKITLTRRALKEFDRRTAVEKSAVEKSAPELLAAAAVEERSTRRLLRSDTMKLRRFAQNGGPNLNSLRGFSAPFQPVANMSTSSSRQGKRTRDSSLPSSDGTKTPGTKTSATTGPYDSNFQQILIDRRVYPDRYEDSDRNSQELANIDSLRELLRTSCSSLSPSRFTNNAFKDFQRANVKARAEAKAMLSVVPIITGVKDNRLETEENIQFNNLEKFALGLKVAMPNKYYGVRPEQVHERIRRELGQYIVPSTNTSLPVAPNFFFKGKSARGRPDIA